MGIVLNQSFRNIISTYVGFGIGAVNVLLLYPHFLSEEYYGLVTFLLSAGNLIWPLMAFGSHNALVKFYSSYKTKLERDKLLTWSLVLPLFAALFLGTLGLAFYGLVMDYFDGQNSLVKPYVWLIYAIAVAVAYFEVFFAWGKVQLKSVFGNFMREVFHRVCTMVLLILVFYGMISVETFVYLLVLVYVLRTLLIGIYALCLYRPRFVFEYPRNKLQVLKYAFLMLIAGSVAMALLDLDKVMIEYYLPIENVAVYAIAIFIASVVAVPVRAMNQIMSPLTASLLNQNDKIGMEDLYKRSSVSLLVVGGLVFLLIIANVNQLYRIIPEEYHIGASVVFLISVVRLYDNLLGNANSILFNSNYYRLVLLLGVLLVATAIVLNLLMIPRFGIYGAAYATFIAFFVFNSIRLLVVYKKFDLHPFSRKTFVVLMCIAVLTGAFYFWDFTWSPLLNIAIKSCLICAAYILLIYRFNISKDISVLIKKVTGV